MNDYFTCKNCKFFLVSTTVHGEGLCRRYPPVKIWAIKRSRQYHPTVSDCGWCGEIKTKK